MVQPDTEARHRDGSRVERSLLDRRGDILRAAATIAARDGLEAVSVRRVAAEASVSPALVQHHFPSKDQLLRRTLEDVNEIAAAAASLRLEAAAREDVGVVRFVRLVLEEFLPLDAGRDLALRVHLAYFARSARDPAIARLYTDTTRGAVQLLAAVLRDSAVRDDENVWQDTDALVSLATALGTEITTGIRTLVDARALLDSQISRVLRDSAS